MRAFLFLILITISIKTTAQSFQAQLPEVVTDIFETDQYKINIDTLSGKFIITKNHHNKLNKSIRREIFSGDLSTLDTILFVTDLNSKICQIRFFACGDKRSFQHKTFKLNKFLNSERTINSIYLGTWDYSKFGKKILSVVSTLNSFIKQENLKCNSTLKTQLLNLSSSGRQSISDRGVVYEIAEEMPGYNGSKTIEDRDKVIQDYVDECIAKGGFKESGLAIINFTILEDGSINYLGFPYVESKNIRAHLETCINKMSGWKPGKNKFGLQKVEISSIIGVNLKDKNAELEKLLTESSLYVKSKRKTIEKDTINFDEIADMVFGPEDKETNEVYKVVESNPQHPDGKDFFKDYLLTIKNQIHTDYKDLKGSIVVRFIVEKNGSISNVTILRTPNSAITEIVKQEFITMPKWIPGKQRGRPVRVEKTEIINL